MLSQQIGLPLLLPKQVVIFSASGIFTLTRILHVERDTPDCNSKEKLHHFIQLRSHLVCFTHLNPLLAGGRLAAGARLFAMLANTLNKAVAPHGGGVSFFLFLFFCFSVQGSCS